MPRRRLAGAIRQRDSRRAVPPPLVPGVVSIDDQAMGRGWGGTGRVARARCGDERASVWTNFPLFGLFRIFAWLCPTRSVTPEVAGSSPVAPVSICRDLAWLTRQPPRPTTRLPHTRRTRAGSLGSELSLVSSRRQRVERVAPDSTLERNRGLALLDRPRPSPSRYAQTCANAWPPRSRKGGAARRRGTVVSRGWPS
jgi:hypothetical protein